MNNIKKKKTEAILDESHRYLDNCIEIIKQQNPAAGFMLLNLRIKFLLRIKEIERQFQ